MHLASYGSLGLPGTRVRHSRTAALWEQVWGCSGCLEPPQMVWRLGLPAQGAGSSGQGQGPLREGSGRGSFLQKSTSLPADGWDDLQGAGTCVGALPPAAGPRGSPWPGGCTGCGLEPRQALALSPPPSQQHWEDSARAWVKGGVFSRRRRVLWEAL